MIRVGVFLFRWVPWLALAVLWFYTNAPLTVFMRVTEVTRYEDRMVAWVVGIKLPARGCAFVPKSEAGYAGVAGKWVKVPFRFLNDLSPGSSRPAGFNDFGLWEWSSLPPEAESVITTVAHACPTGPVVTTAGPFASR